MSDRNFWKMLKMRWFRNHFVCVGLDSDLNQIPEAVKASEHFVMNTISRFNQAIIDATWDLVCAYKINTAFYEAQGVEGILALRKTTFYIQGRAPEVPIILDAKKADIDSSNEGYVQAAFDYFGVDAITVHPFLGGAALRPFLEHPDKGIFVLCRTSNLGAGEFQDLVVTDGWPVYQIVAWEVANHWNKNGNCGVVVGATYPEELAQIRKTVGDLPILIPGIGAQGSDVKKTVKAGMDSRKQGMIINSSRGIIFASNGPDFAEAARRETIKLRDMINQHTNLQRRKPREPKIRR